MKLKSRKKESIIKVIQISIFVGILSFFGLKSGERYFEKTEKDKKLENNFISSKEEGDNCVITNNEENTDNYLYVGCNNFF